MHVDIRIGAAHVSSHPAVTKGAEASQRTESGPSSRRSSPMPSPRPPPRRPLRRVRHRRGRRSQERAGARGRSDDRQQPVLSGAELGPLVGEQHAPLGRLPARHQGRGDHRPVGPATRQRVRVRRIVGQYGHLGVRQPGKAPGGHGGAPGRAATGSGRIPAARRGAPGRPAARRPRRTATASRASASDQPSGKGLPGGPAAPATISRARQTVRHTTEKDEHPRGLSRPLRPSPARAARAAVARRPAPGR